MPQRSLGAVQAQSVLPLVSSSFKFVFACVAGITHWQSPGFFAYFPSNSSPASLIGDMLSTGYSCVSFSWITSPAATELETIVLDWFAKLLGLPNVFLSDAPGGGGGVVQASASDAVCTLQACVEIAGLHVEAPRTPRHLAYASLNTQLVVAMLAARQRAKTHAKEQGRSFEQDKLVVYAGDLKSFCVAVPGLCICCGVHCPLTDMHPIKRTP